VDPAQTAGVGQKLTISTSALIASSLCGAVHSAGVPYSQPPGTGLCFSASAAAVQKAAGARLHFHVTLYSSASGSVPVPMQRPVRRLNVTAQPRTSRSSTCV